MLLKFLYKYEIKVEGKKVIFACYVGVRNFLTDDY